MSGGAMDYLCDRIDSEAEYLMDHHDPVYRQFGAYLKRVARACHDVEWAMSCDISHKQARATVAELLSGGSVNALELADMRERLDDINERLTAMEKGGKP